MTPWIWKCPEEAVLEGRSEESLCQDYGYLADSLAKRCHSYLKRVWMTRLTMRLGCEYEIDGSMKDKRLKCLISYQGIMLAEHPLSGEEQSTFRAVIDRQTLLEPISMRIWNGPRKIQDCLI